VRGACSTGCTFGSVRSENGQDQSRSSPRCALCSPQHPPVQPGGRRVHCRCAGRVGRGRYGRTARMAVGTLGRDGARRWRWRAQTILRPQSVVAAGQVPSFKPFRHTWATLRRSSTWSHPLSISACGVRHACLPAFGASPERRAAENKIILQSCGAIATLADVLERHGERASIVQHAIKCMGLLAPIRACRASRQSPRVALTGEHAADAVVEIATLPRLQIVRHALDIHKARPLRETREMFKSFSYIAEALINNRTPMRAQQSAPSRPLLSRPRSATPLHVPRGGAGGSADDNHQRPRLGASCARPRRGMCGEAAPEWRLCVIRAFVCITVRSRSIEASAQAGGDAESVSALYFPNRTHAFITGSRQRACRPAPSRSA
jgi:hypothetical protein